MAAKAAKKGRQAAAKAAQRAAKAAQAAARAAAAAADVYKRQLYGSSHTHSCYKWLAAVIESLVP